MIRATTFAFTATIFLGSFLLFAVQPIIGKYIQPYFGSTSAVWNTCLMFFQGTLFIGYLYAHGLARRPARQQVTVHLTIMLAVALLGAYHFIKWGSPILPSITAIPTSHPALAVLRLLGLGIGLPFLLLASNSTLIQYWFARAEPNQNAYALYAVSNAGSLLALLLYPFLLEPLIGLALQARVWFGLLAVYAMLAICCARLAGRREVAASEPTPLWGGMPARSIVHWFLLTMTGSILLMAVTSELTQDVSPIPFLWVLPLAIYLLTFIIGFSRIFNRPRPLNGLLLLVGTGCALVALRSGLALSIGQLILLMGAALFFIALYCHGTLYSVRPDHRHLTFFYLIVSLGGFAGGFFVSILAPLLFPAYWELHLGLALALLLFVYGAVRLKELAIPIRAAFIALALAGLVLLGHTWRNSHKDALWMDRNFYGTIRVERESRGEGEQVIHRTIMKHGEIIHGIQFSRTAYRYRPIAYFFEQSGVGRAIEHHPLRAVPNRPFRIGVVGGGIGTLVAYARPGDMVHLYELNPSVQDLALNTDYFTYLADFKGRWTARIGDGRLLLDEERAAGDRPPFDVLIIDAFNGDAVPMHLLTKEAISLYLDSIDPENGILALQITNKHVDFAPLIRAIANHFRLNAVVISTPGDSNITQTNRWALLTRNPNTLLAPVFRAGQQSLIDVPEVPLWTDDRSSLLPLLRF